MPGKYLPVLLILCLVCAFTIGCSDKKAAQPDTDIPDTITQPETNDTDQTPPPENNEPETSPQDGVEEDPEPDDGVDVDLTVLSSTMVYAEVFNIMSNSDDYIGKTIKAKGPYYASFYDVTDKYYHYIIIEDATACCTEGIEFRLNTPKKYPEDFPADDTQIEIAGVFNSYEELHVTYYYLAVDGFSIL